MLTEANIAYLDNVLVNIVNERGPIRAMEMIPEFFAALGPTSPDLENLLAQNMLVHDIGQDYDVTQRLEHLVKTRQVIEVEYVLPKLDYRIKSMFFPVGSKITIR